MTDNHITATDTLVCIPADIARRAAAALDGMAGRYAESAHDYRRKGDEPSAALMDIQAKRYRADAAKIREGVK